MKKFIKDAIEYEKQHLMHMETAIIPILIALTIFGLTLRLDTNDTFEITIISYLLGTSFFLSILHLKAMVLDDLRGRISMFFTDAFVLVVYAVTIPLLILRQIIFGGANLFDISFGEILYILISGCIAFILSWIFLIFKIIPTFEIRIFPSSCKIYKIPKFKYEKRFKDDF